MKFTNACLAKKTNVINKTHYISADLLATFFFQVDKTSVLKESMVGTPSYMSPEALIGNYSTSEKPKYKVSFIIYFSH